MFEPLYLHSNNKNVNKDTLFCIFSLLLLLLLPTKGNLHCICPFLFSGSFSLRKKLQGENYECKVKVVFVKKLLTIW